MHELLSTISLLAALLAVSCAPKSWAIQDPADQAEAREELDRFERTWLHPARIAPPNVVFEPRTATRGDLAVTVAPLRPEAAPWNTWPGPTARLFNNRAALLFEVAIEGEGPVRWVPGATTLELNDAGDPLSPARAPDEVLVPLLQAALVQERYGIDGDFVERTRGAGPFRGAYLPTSPVETPVMGLIAFPLTDPEQHVVAFRITLGVEGPDGLRRIPILYE